MEQSKTPGWHLEYVKEQPILLKTNFAQIFLEVRRKKSWFLRQIEDPIFVSCRKILKEKVWVWYFCLVFGVINWFAVHPTSMNKSNHLISGDNKGLASQLLEKAMNSVSETKDGTFVAAFASSNLGDVSPNLKGPKCINTGEDCNMKSMTCEGRVQNCIAFGPGDTMKESTWIIGNWQFLEAKKLLNQAKATFMVTELKY